MTERLNWRAVNGETGEECGHRHHSQQSARRCAKTMGWERFYVETYNGGRQYTPKEHEGSKKKKRQGGYNKRVARILAHQVNADDVGTILGKEEIE